MITPPQGNNNEAPAIPAEFADTLCIYSENTLTHWLKENNAPAEVLDLVNAMGFYSLYVGYAKTGKVDAGSNSQAEELLAPTLRALTVLGAEWETPSGTVPNPNPPLVWRPAKDESGQGDAKPAARRVAKGQ